MKKKLLLLAGILLLGATTFAAEEQEKVDAEKAVEIITTTDSSAIEKLVAGRQTGDDGVSGSYVGEVKVRMYQGPGRSDKTGDNYKNSANKIETTLAKGKINMGNFGLIYDVDRDTNFNKNWNKTSEGWDTKFGLDYQGGKFDMYGKEWTFNPSVTYEYETKENFTSRAVDPSARDSEAQRLLKLNSKISTTYYGFATDITPILAYDDLKGTVAFQLNITNFRKLNDSWSTSGDVYLDFAGSKNDKNESKDKTKRNGHGNRLFEGNIDGDNKFAFSIEQYLNYEKNITGNLYFATEFALEAYSILQSTANDVALYVEPRLFYKMDLGGSTLTPYVSYTAYSATGGYTDSYQRDELSIGVKFGTKF